jgi:hypothetical protein
MRAAHFKSAVYFFEQKRVLSALKGDVAAQPVDLVRWIISKPKTKRKKQNGKNQR